MEHQEKIQWMINWAHKNKVILNLEGECGFGRECVGIIASNQHYPDYEWYNEESWERIDNNGEIFFPKDAYHIQPCVAVLGRGENAESQLYDWLKWFDDNGFIVKVVDNPNFKKGDVIGLIMGNNKHARMVKKSDE